MLCQISLSNFKENLMCRFINSNITCSLFLFRVLLRMALNMGLELFHMVHMAYGERMQINSNKTVECRDHRLSVYPFSSGTLDPSAASFQGLRVLLSYLNIYII